MNHLNRRRWRKRWLAPFALALAMLAGAPPEARAQAAGEAPAEGEGGGGGGGPVAGYFGVGLLSALTLFIIGKSARR